VPNDGNELHLDALLYPPKFIQFLTGQSPCFSWNMSSCAAGRLGSRSSSFLVYISSPPSSHPVERIGWWRGSLS